MLNHPLSTLCVSGTSHVFYFNILTEYLYIIYKHLSHENSLFAVLNIFKMFFTYRYFFFSILLYSLANNYWQVFKYPNFVVTARSDFSN